MYCVPALISMKKPTIIAKAPIIETFLDLSLLSWETWLSKKAFWFELIFAQTESQVASISPISIPNRIAPRIINAIP